MPSAASVEAVGHGELSHSLGIWILCTLILCMLAVLHFWSCEGLQLSLDLSSSVMGNYNTGKSQRFMNLWSVPCHSENSAALHSQHFIDMAGLKRLPQKLCHRSSDLSFLSPLVHRNVFLCTAGWWTGNLNSVRFSGKMRFTLDHIQSPTCLVH